MQPQRSKANKMDEKAKDFLISTFPAKKNQVMLMNGKIVSKL
jgi:hypothetical protein